MKSMGSIFSRMFRIMARRWRAALAECLVQLGCVTKVYGYSTTFSIQPPLREAPSTRFPRHEVFSYQRTTLAHSMRCRAVYQTANHTQQGWKFHTFPKEPSHWDNRVVHTGLPFGEQVFTHCNLSCSSQSSRSRGTHVLPDRELRSYFSSSVCSGHPMGRSTTNGMIARTAAELHSLSVAALGGS
jgi:hypothetical protein